MRASVAKRGVLIALALGVVAGVPVAAQAGIIDGAWHFLFGDDDDDYVCCYPPAPVCPPVAAYCPPALVCPPACCPSPCGPLGCPTGISAGFGVQTAMSPIGLQPVSETAYVETRYFDPATGHYTTVRRPLEQPVYRESGTPDAGTTDGAGDTGFGPSEGSGTRDGYLESTETQRPDDLFTPREVDAQDADAPPPAPPTDIDEEPESGIRLLDPGRHVTVLPLPERAFRTVAAESAPEAERRVVQASSPGWVATPRQAVASSAR